MLASIRREGRARQDALRRAIITRRHGLACPRPRPFYQTVHHAGRVVTPHSPEQQDCSGKTLEEALAWCLVWLMAKGTPHPKGLDWGHEISVLV